MKTIEELFEEVQKRMSAPKLKEWKERYNFGVFTVWNQLQAIADNDEGPVLLSAIQAHENLLRIVVCINERAIDAWIDGLIEIQRNN